MRVDTELKISLETDSSWLTLIVFLSAPPLHSPSFPSLPRGSPFLLPNFRPLPLLLFLPSLRFFRSILSLAFFSFNSITLFSFTAHPFLPFLSVSYSSSPTSYSCLHSSSSLLSVFSRLLDQFLLWYFFLLFLQLLSILSSSFPITLPWSPILASSPLPPFPPLFLLSQTNSIYSNPSFSSPDSPSFTLSVLSTHPLLLTANAHSSYRRPSLH